MTARMPDKRSSRRIQSNARLTHEQHVHAHLASSCLLSGALVTDVLAAKLDEGVLCYRARAGFLPRLRDTRRVADRR